MFASDQQRVRWRFACRYLTPFGLFTLNDIDMKKQLASPIAASLLMAFSAGITSYQCFVCL
jgi:hypothetical protein